MGLPKLVIDLLRFLIKKKSHNCPKEICTTCVGVWSVADNDRISNIFCCQDQQDLYHSTTITLFSELAELTAARASWVHPVIPKCSMVVVQVYRPVFSQLLDKLMCIYCTIDVIFVSERH